MNIKWLALAFLAVSVISVPPALAQQSEPSTAAVSAFRAAPTSANAAQVPQTCGTVSATGSVYLRYEQAVARRKCLEKSSELFVSTVSTSPDPAARTVAATEVPPTKADEKAAEEEEEKLWAEKSFLGFNWAVGVGYSFGKGPQRVADAEVVNGIVRVKDDNTDQAVALLEIHHLFEGSHGFGWGPFASVQTGEGDTALSFGTGLEFGWRDRDPKSAGGFLFGVGYAWTQGVKVLGDGIVANEALPTGETEVRFKNRSAGAWLIFVSRRFDLSGPNTK